MSSSSCLWEKRKRTGKNVRLQVPRARKKGNFPLDQVYSMGLRMGGQNGHFSPGDWN